MGKRFEQVLYKSDIQIADSHIYKKLLKVIRNLGNKNKNHNDKLVHTDQKG